MFTKAKQLIMMYKEEGYTNLLSFGGCEATTGWTTLLGTLATDSDNEYEGTNCLKITINSGQTTAFSYRNILSLLNISKYYLYSGYVKNYNGTTGMKISVDCKADKGLIVSTSNITTDYVRKGILLQPSDFDTATELTIRSHCDGSAAQYGYFDALMVNEISVADYAAGVAACLTKYPYKAP